MNRRGRRSGLGEGLVCAPGSPQLSECRRTVLVCPGETMVLASYEAARGQLAPGHPRLAPHLLTQEGA